MTTVNQRDDAYTEAVEALLPDRFEAARHQYFLDVYGVSEEELAEQVSLFNFICGRDLSDEDIAAMIFSDEDRAAMIAMGLPVPSTDE